MLPLIVLAVAMEMMLRTIPNDYGYKNDYLTHYSASVEVLFLGSSHSYYDINPAYIHRPSFNASYISQSLDYDNELLKKHGDRIDSLKCIALSISYFTLFTKIENTSEAWRIKNYTIYCEMNKAKHWTDYTEMLSNKLSLNLKRLSSYYLDHKSNRTCTNLGWGTDYNSSIKNNLKESGNSAAERHTVLDTNCYRENVNILRSIITYAHKRNIKVLFYTLPAYKTYVNKLNQKQLDITIRTVEELEYQYKNVNYFNWIDTPSFQETDFFDADHLNEIGAEKLTKKIDSLINKM